jgi:hypothetical protein
MDANTRMGYLTVYEKGPLYDERLSKEGRWRSRTATYRAECGQQNSVVDHSAIRDLDKQVCILNGLSSTVNPGSPTDSEEACLHIS